MRNTKNPPIMSKAKNPPARPAIMTGDSKNSLGLFSKSELEVFDEIKISLFILLVIVVSVDDGNDEEVIFDKVFEDVVLDNEVELVA
jgi:hypothetical protein